MNYLTTSYMQAIPLAISSLSLLLSYRTARLDITVPFEAVSQSSLLALISQLPHIFSKENPSGFGLTCTSGRVHFWVKRKKNHTSGDQDQHRIGTSYFLSLLYLLSYIHPIPKGLKIVFWEVISWANFESIWFFPPVLGSRSLLYVKHKKSEILITMRLNRGKIDEIKT